MAGRFGKLAFDKDDDGLGNKAPPKATMGTLSNQRDRAAAAEKKEKEAPTAGRWGGRVSEKVLSIDAEEPRKLRSDLTPEEKAKMEKYGSVGFKSAKPAYDPQNYSYVPGSKNMGHKFTKDTGRYGGRASEKAPARDVVLQDSEFMERLNDIDRQEKRGRLTPQEAEMARKELKSKQEDLHLLPAQDISAHTQAILNRITFLKKKGKPEDLEAAKKLEAMLEQAKGKDEDEDIALHDKKRDIPGIATDPPVSEAQRKAMWAAKGGHSTLGIPQSVGKEFAGADPGGKLPEHK